jgi:hypothetical protein
MANGWHAVSRACACVSHRNCSARACYASGSTAEPPDALPGRQSEAACTNRLTPLHMASANGTTAVVELLLAHGADVNATGEGIAAGSGAHAQSSAQRMRRLQSRLACRCAGVFACCCCVCVLRGRVVRRIRTYVSTGVCTHGIMHAYYVHVLYIDVYVSRCIYRAISRAQHTHPHSPTHARTQKQLRTRSSRPYSPTWRRSPTDTRTHTDTHTHTNRTQHTRTQTHQQHTYGHVHTQRKGCAQRGHAARTDVLRRFSYARSAAGSCRSILPLSTGTRPWCRRCSRTART